ncbi:MAG: PspC domain-containing protein [Gaiellaceae bacterium]
MTDEPLEPETPAPRPEPAHEPEPHQASQEPPRPKPPSGTPATEARRLYRSRDDRVIAGVCGGLGEYFGIDSVLIRIAFVLLIFAGGAGILAYVLAWIFISEEPGFASGGSASTLDRTAPAERTTGALALGLVFVGLGVLFLLDVAWPDFLSWRYIWPIALIAVGAAIILREQR